MKKWSKTGLKFKWIPRKISKTNILYVTVTREALETATSIRWNASLTSSLKYVVFCDEYWKRKQNSKIDKGTY